MAKPDISNLTLEELTALIDEANKLRAGKIEAKRNELQKQLAELDAIASPASTPKRERASPKPLYRGPNGIEWSGRGAIPRAFRELGVTDKAGLEKYRIKE